MVDMTITARGPHQFDVRLRDRDVETSHRVTVPDELIEEFDLPEGDLERVVRVSFDFLLEREPASSIMSDFSLHEVARYFPEYSQELPRRL